MTIFINGGSAAWQWTFAREGSEGASLPTTDTDGDGVSDFWEFAMNTNYKDPSSKPDLSDPAIFQAMKMAGTSCPYEGLIGDAAARAWEVHTEDIPVPTREHEKSAQEKRDDALKVMGSVAAALLLFALALALQLQ